MTDVRLLETRIAKAEARLAEDRQRLAYYKQFDGLPTIAFNSIRRAMYEADGENAELYPSPDRVRQFIALRTDAELKSCRNLGKVSMRNLRTWAGGTVHASPIRCGASSPELTTQYVDKITCAKCYRIVVKSEAASHG